MLIKNVNLFKVILASGSPRRKKLLQLLHQDFQVVIPDVEECSSSSNPVELAQEIAALKGVAVFSRLDVGEYPVITIAADTIVVVDGQVLGKPAGRDEASFMLGMLSGRKHQVITAVDILATTDKTPSNSPGHFPFWVQTDVTFTKLDRQLIEQYLECGEWSDKAGAYGIQGAAASLVESINGSYSNVVGLPLAELRYWLNHVASGETGEEKGLLT